MVSLGLTSHFVPHVVSHCVSHCVSHLVSHFGTPTQSSYPTLVGFIGIFALPVHFLCDALLDVGGLVYALGCLIRCRNLVRCHGCTLRCSHGSWIQWIPRERNLLADSLANLALDRNSSFAVKCPALLHRNNCIMMSDGAVRGSGQASAAWAILETRGAKSFSLVAAGAKLLTGSVSSLEAEAQALHLAVQAYTRFVCGYVIICPHMYDSLIQQEELSSDILYSSKCT